MKLVRLLAICLFVVLLAGMTAGDARAGVTSEKKTVTSEDAQTVEVQSGMLAVPENRTQDNGRMISIAY